MDEDATTRAGAVPRHVPRQLFLGCIALLPLLLAGCLEVGGGCSAEEAAAFVAIDHYPGAELIPRDHPFGACADVLVTSDDPDGVVEHYRSALERAGYDVGPVESGPMTMETGESIGRTIAVSATDGTFSASISAEVFGGGDTEFVILVGEAQ